VQFAKTSNPNNSALPIWPAYQESTDLCQELGQRIGAERVPRAERFEVFQQFLDSRLAKAAQ
jgi:carboxylesterase type B